MCYVLSGRNLFYFRLWILFFAFFFVHRMNFFFLWMSHPCGSLVQLICTQRPKLGMTSFVFHLRHGDLDTSSCLRWMCYWFSSIKPFTLARFESAMLYWLSSMFWHIQADKAQKCRSNTLNCVLGIRYQRKWEQPSSKWWQKDTDF